jgi:hypothetical protein
MKRIAINLLFMKVANKFANNYFKFLLFKNNKYKYIINLLLNIIITLLLIEILSNLIKFI